MLALRARQTERIIRFSDRDLSPVPAYNLSFCLSLSDLPSPLSPFELVMLTLSGKRERFSYLS